MRRFRPEASLAPVNAKSKCIELPLLVIWNGLTPLNEKLPGIVKSIDKNHPTPKYGSLSNVHIAECDVGQCLEQLYHDGIFYFHMQSL